MKVAFVANKEELLILLVIILLLVFRLLNNMLKANACHCEGFSPWQSVHQTLISILAKQDRSSRRLRLLRMTVRLFHHINS